MSHHDGGVCVAKDGGTLSIQGVHLNGRTIAHLLSLDGVRRPGFPLVLCGMSIVVSSSAVDRAAP
jgi:hypothetical protein